MKAVACGQVGVPPVPAQRDRGTGDPQAWHLGWLAVDGSTIKACKVSMAPGLSRYHGRRSHYPPRRSHLCRFLGPISLAAAYDI